MPKKGKLISKNYKNTFLFRLINVLFIFLLAIGVVISYLISSSDYKPRVDIEDTSYIQCIGHYRTATLTSLGIITYSGNRALYPYEDKYAREFCSIRFNKFTGEKIIDSTKNYRLIPRHSENKVGNWSDFIFFTIFYSSISFGVLYVIREAVLYLFFNKRFLSLFFDPFIKGKKK